LHADPHAFHVDPPAGGDRITFTVRLWVDAGGQPISCEIGQSPLPQVAQTGCAQLMGSARFQLFPGMAFPLRRGFVDVNFSFYTIPSGPLAGEQVTATAIPTYANTTIAYPLDDAPAFHLLRNIDGALVMRLRVDEYPAIAMRFDLQSVSSVLLGFSRDGKVGSCRPVSSSSGPNTAYLDNYTCSIFMRRGHFQFLPTSPIYSGLRYARQVITWRLPH
jgi:hypothetical protein